MTQPPMEHPWYAEKREKWKPEKVKLLLIAESAPHVEHGSPLRYFYDENLTRYDGLFRETVKALLGVSQISSGPGKKVPYLAELKARGVFLIDLAPFPVDKGAVKDRNRTLSLHVNDCVTRAGELRPDGIVVVKANVHKLLARPLLNAGLPLLNLAPIPFPGSGQQLKFRKGIQEALARAAFTL